VYLLLKKSKAYPIFQDLFVEILLFLLLSSYPLLKMLNFILSIREASEMFRKTSEMFRKKIELFRKRYEHDRNSDEGSGESFEVFREASDASGERSEIFRKGSEMFREGSEIFRERCGYIRVIPSWGYFQYHLTHPLPPL